MVASITSLTGNGLKDWLIQRATAVIVAAYVLYLLWFVCTHTQISFADWHALFASTWMQIATVVTLLAICWHAWIGVWTVTTDYLNCVCVRLAVQAAVALALIGYFFWGLQIVWGIK